MLLEFATFYHIALRQIHRVLGEVIFNEIYGVPLEPHSNYHYER